LNDEFNAKLVYLIPILASLLFGLFCAFLILTSPMEIYGVAPFPEGILGSFGNAVYFVVLAGIGASLLYLLLKRKNRKLVMLIVGFALTTAVFVLSIIYLTAALTRFAIPYSEAIVLASSIPITVLVDFAIFRTRKGFGDLIVLCLGGGLGTFLGFSIPTLSTVLILAFLAVYDAFTVYRGPVGKIAHIGLGQLRGLSFSFEEVEMGLGDLTFYSMLSGHMLFYFGVVSCLLSTVGILLGCQLSFKMLEKKGILPGLPFPIILGLTAGLLGSLVGL
jgi:hypothetical protein